MQRAAGPAASAASPSPSPPSSIRRGLLQPRVLIVLLLGLVLVATFLSLSLFSVDDGAWTPSIPFTILQPATPQYGAVGPGGGGAGVGGTPWLKRPDTMPLRRVPLEQRGSGNASAVGGGGDAIAGPLDPMSVYARCHNTRQGRKLVTDDAGAICARQNVLPNGCCRSSSVIDTQSCAMCRTDVQCCRSYEYCVSCCLAALPTDDRAEDNRESSGAPARFSFHSFDKCLHLCRTSSRSIKHGNVYKTAVLKHCYTEGEHALPVKFDDDNARVLVAPQGVSCTRACQAYRGRRDEALPAGWMPPMLPVDDDSDTPSPLLPPPAAPALFICHEAFLPLINTCDTMKRHFLCDGDKCDTNAGNDQPALVVATTNAVAIAPHGGKQLRGQCLLNGDAKLFDCEGHHEATNRLCVCIHADKAE